MARNLTSLNNRVKKNRTAVQATTQGQALKAAKTAASGFAGGVAGRTPERKAARAAVTTARAARAATPQAVSLGKAKAAKKAFKAGM